MSSGNSRVLPNTYVPVMDVRVSGAILSRLSKMSLVELLMAWPKLANTQPVPSGNHSKWTQTALNDHIMTRARGLKRNIAKTSKKAIIHLILFNYWSQGLNLLQLSQVDCQLIVDRPNSYYWVTSSVFDQQGRLVPLSLNPNTFLAEVSRRLSMFYLNYIYICRHPSLPLILLRIQVFDLSIDKAAASKNPHISSYKPYFVAFPTNSPHIIHTPGNNTITKILIQAIQQCLPQNTTNLLQIRQNENETPTRSLESMHILNGSSRFGHSLGIWAPYADGTIDILPLSKPEDHALLQRSKYPTPSDDDTDDGSETDNNDEINPRELKRLKRIANLRFKGTTTGKYKSTKLFDDNTTRRSRRLLAVPDSEDESEDEKSVSEFASIAPIQHVTFKLEQNINKENPQQFTSISMSLTGLDVFAGLHELSVSTTKKDDVIVDPTTIPDWLTGQEGSSSGTIRDSTFTKES